MESVLVQRHRAQCSELNKYLSLLPGHSLQSLSVFKGKEASLLASQHEKLK